MAAEGVSAGEYRLVGQIAMLTARVNELEDRMRSLEDAPVEIGAAFGGDDAATDQYPFKLYKYGGYLCCSEGNLYWFNEIAGAVTVHVVPEENGVNSWPIDSYSTVYVRRTYNADGTATVELVRTSDSIATVKGGQTNTEMRFILGTCSSTGVITQRHFGDIEEARVA